MDQTVCALVRCLLDSCSVLLGPSVVWEGCSAGQNKAARLAPGRPSWSNVADAPVCVEKKTLIQLTYIFFLQDYSNSDSQIHIFLLNDWLLRCAHTLNQRGRWWADDARNPTQLLCKELCGCGTIFQAAWGMWGISRIWQWPAVTLLLFDFGLRLPLLGGRGCCEVRLMCYTSSEVAM